jgi:hypothetical protein
MKIAQLLSGVKIALTNQEQEFIEEHKNQININGLDEHNQWIARNLVRKGIYSLSKDTHTLIKNLHETTS